MLPIQAVNTVAEMLPITSITTPLATVRPSLACFNFLRFRRRQLGLTQKDFATHLGVSKGQYANAIRGHDPISAFAVNRARELSWKSCEPTSVKDLG
jgi:hypothetical protein